MPQTPVSTTTAYCTTAQFINWYDVRTTGDLVMDDGSRATPGQLVSNAVLLQFLQEASGKVEAACLIGGRYTVADLQALLVPISGKLSNSAIFLAGIVSGIAGGELSRRRPGVDIPESLKEKIEEGKEALKALADGEIIFAFEETAAAGLIQEEYDSPGNVWARQGTAVQMQRFFGRRANRYWNPPRPTVIPAAGGVNEG
jgi:hypothetical protein